MPTDVLSSFSCFSGQSFPKKTCTAELKTGFLVLISPEKLRQDVRVVVYSTTLEHFAVIYPRKRLSNAIGVVNLKNTSVERIDGENGFIVRQKGYDNTTSAKFLCSEREMESWIVAFTFRTTSGLYQTNSLPVLIEDEENYDN